MRSRKTFCTRSLAIAFGLSLVMNLSAFGVIKGYRMTGCGDKATVEEKLIQAAISSPDLCGEGFTPVHTGGTSCHPTPLKDCAGQGLVCNTQFNCVEKNAAAPIAAPSVVATAAPALSSPSPSPAGAITARPSIAAARPSPSAVAQPSPSSPVVALATSPVTATMPTPVAAVVTPQAMATLTPQATETPAIQGTQPTPHPTREAVKISMEGLGNTPPPMSTNFLLLNLIATLVLIVSLWKVFEKGGMPGYYAIIPLFNLYKLHQLAGQSGWLIIVDCIPIVNLVSYFVMNLKLARRFGFGVGMTLLLIFLPFFALPYLAFNPKVTYT